MITGKIHSIQTLGTLDGPGVRFVVFMQGCNLRCHCCHNPDTWKVNGGREYLPVDIVNRAKRYREYFGKDGGITLSGGEPLLQPKFVYETFRLCHENGINTCLDTSGNILDKNIVDVLLLCDRILLDIKYTDNESYMKYVGCSLDSVIEFLNTVDRMNIPTTLRQVVIPTVNDNYENFVRLNAIAKRHECVTNTELLPFRKICTTKYEMMGIDFPFSHINEPSASEIEKYQKILT